MKRIILIFLVLFFSLNSVVSADEIYVPSNAAILIERSTGQILDETDQLILKLLLQKKSYETIAAQSFLSVNGIKYRLKRLIERCGIEDRKTLEYYLTEYLQWPQ